MTFALGIPEPYWRGPLDRWVLRHAMAGWLPDAVRLNRRIGLQAADLLTRLRTHSRDLDRVLEEVAGNAVAASYADIAYLRATADRLQTSGDYSARRASATVLLRGLGAGAFVARGQWDTP